MRAIYLVIIIIMLYSYVIILFHLSGPEAQFLSKMGQCEYMFVCKPSYEAEGWWMKVLSTQVVPGSMTLGAVD